MSTRTNACRSSRGVAAPNRNGRRSRKGRSKACASTRRIFKGPDIASGDPLRCEEAGHAAGGGVRFGKHIGLVREPEKLGKMDQRAGALLSADHAEMALQAVQIG